MSTSSWQLRARTEVSNSRASVPHSSNTGPITTAKLIRGFLGFGEWSKDGEASSHQLTKALRLRPLLGIDHSLYACTDVMAAKLKPMFEKVGVKFYKVFLIKNDKHKKKRDNDNCRHHHDRAVRHRRQDDHPQAHPLEVRKRLHHAWSRASVRGSKDREACQSSTDQSTPSASASRDDHKNVHACTDAIAAQLEPKFKELGVDFYKGPDVAMIIVPTAPRVTVVGCTIHNVFMGGFGAGAFSGFASGSGFGGGFAGGEGGWGGGRGGGYGGHFYGHGGYYHGGQGSDTGGGGVYLPAIEGFAGLTITGLAQDPPLFLGGGTTPPPLPPSAGPANGPAPATNNIGLPDHDPFIYNGTPLTASSEDFGTGSPSEASGEDVGVAATEEGVGAGAAEEEDDEEFDELVREEGDFGFGLEGKDGEMSDSGAQGAKGRVEGDRVEG